MLLAVTIIPRPPGVAVEMKSGTVSALSSFGFRLSNSPGAWRKAKTCRNDPSYSRQARYGNTHKVSAVTLLTQTHLPEVLLSVSPIQDPICHHASLEICFG